MQIVGVVRDARYRNLREPITPTVYVPSSQPQGSASLIVRTSIPNTSALAGILRHEVPRARPEFRVSNIRSQEEHDRQQTVRERLLALIAVFFAAVALLLSGVGLYGVLDYSVLQRRREIGIRIAIGAPAGDIARRVVFEAAYMVLAGAVLGLAAGLASVQSVAALLYHVSGTDPAMLALPSLTVLASTALAAVPALVRALRIDPVAMLRAE
jgi:predicted lysophospholipase L1 biosynthesis ABC-type transport system permease subunit